MEFFFDRNKPKKQKDAYGKLASQQKLRLAMAFLNPLRPIVNESWGQYGEGKKSKTFGQALRKVIQDATEGDYPDQHVNPEKVMISMGTLPVPEVTDTVRSPGSLEVRYESLPHPLAKDLDQLVLVVYSPELGMGARNDQTSYRIDGRIEVELPPQFEQGAFHAYLFCHNARKTRFSKSRYLGYFEPMGQIRRIR